jgi:putative ABC transport system permease protein
MNIFLKLTKESIIIAFQEITNNKLRAFLSLLGITIGIFCIISVFTAVDSLEKNVKTSFQKLGDNVVYVQKQPWDEDPSQSWWKYFRRPTAKYNEYKVLQSKLQSADAVAMMLYLGGKTVKHEGFSVENVTVGCVTHDYYRLREMEFDEGRYFSLLESMNGMNVCFLGHKIANELFPTSSNNIVGKTVKVLGKEVRVIGVLKREGDDVLGWTSDDNIFLPYAYVNSFLRLNSWWTEPFIAIKSKDNVAMDYMTEEVRQVMRAVRKQKPKEPDNFAINKLSIITGVLNIVFGVIGFAGGAIGVFSIIVGAFGIANIMFVSVKERTSIIGIKKALGAKRIFILIEFLIEAMVLCLIGGLLGLFFVWIESYVLEYLVYKFKEMEFAFILTWENVMKGLVLSVGVGMLAGFIPALAASRMSPVEAIRS